MWYTNNEMQAFIDDIEKLRFSLIDSYTKSLISDSVNRNLNKRSYILMQEWVIDERGIYLTLLTSEGLTEIKFN